jgi:DNA-binding transcriptional LysR family regulator
LVYSQEFQSTTWSYFTKEGKENIAIRPRLLTNNAEVLLQAAAQGLGITRPPDFMTQPYLATKASSLCHLGLSRKSWASVPLSRFTDTSRTVCLFGLIQFQLVPPRS